MKHDEDTAQWSRRPPAPGATIVATATVLALIGAVCSDDPDETPAAATTTSSDASATTTTPPRPPSGSTSSPRASGRPSSSSSRTRSLGLREVGVIGRDHERLPRPPDAAGDHTCADDIELTFTTEGGG